MAKAGVGVKGGWSGDVSKAGSSAGNIGKVESVTFGQTNLSPFTQFTEMISEINSSLASYKGMAEQDVSKMIKAGENKARDDKAGASSMKIVGK
ncbi:MULTISPECIES: hypothetical protein [Enterococcus]|uniref:hypothetical protein n=1 Tax=Enterococcus TaxID=1350 RepID=UPI000EC4AC7B|nr:MULTISPECIES: hypothetical protein [Enterococcus]HCM87840.1 hypothetical protein [Enterococcus sp.]